MVGVVLKESKSDIVKEVADTWFRTNGSAKYRAMTQTMIRQTMQSYNLGLQEAGSR